jgi:hypothetical protein
MRMSDVVAQLGDHICIAHTKVIGRSKIIVCSQFIQLMHIRMQQGIKLIIPPQLSMFIDAFWWSIDALHALKAVTGVLNSLIQIVA